MSIIAGKIKGITITLGADVQPLNKALADVNKKSKDLQSELRQVEKLLKLDPKNTELLAQKQRILAEAVDNSREKLDRLRAAQQQVNEQFTKGEISEEQYRAFQREVAKAEQELAGFEKQLNETAKATDTWKDKLNKAQTSLKEVGAKMTDMGKTLSMSVTAPIVAVGAASFKMAADLQDAMGATEQIFKNAADSVKTWADNLDSYYGIAEGEALEYANMMGTLLMNIGGLTEQEAAKQAQILVQLAGDLTAMFGGETSSAIQALTGALKGNTAMLDNYGIACNDALIKTKALEMGIWDGKGQMDLAAKQAATLALIMEQTGAAQGQAAREAEGASGGMRAFATEIKNLATDIGEVLLPVITPLLNSLGDIVKKFSELSPETQKTIVIITGLAAAIGPLLLILGPVVSAIGTLVTGLGAMSAAMAGGAGIVAGLTAGFPALGAAITLLTGPIGIAIAAIAALIAGGLALNSYMKQSSIEVDLWGSEVSEKTQEAVGGFLKLNDEATVALNQLAWSGQAVSEEMANSIIATFDEMGNQVLTNMQEDHAQQLSEMQAFFAQSAALTDEEEAEILAGMEKHQSEEQQKVKDNQAKIQEILNQAKEEKRAITDSERAIINQIQQEMTAQAVEYMSESEREQKVIMERLKSEASKISAEQAAEVVKKSKEQKDQVVSEAEQQYNDTIAQIIKLRDEAGTITAEQADALIKEATRQKEETILNAEEMHNRIIEEAQAQAGEHIEQVDWETGEVLNNWQVFKKDVGKTWDDIKKKSAKTWDDIKKKSAKTWDKIKAKAEEKWDNIKTAIISPIESAKQKVLDIIDTIRNAFADLRIEIPRPKLPHVSVNWKSVEVGNAKVSIPDFDLNWYKMGGIFNRPSIIGVGEAGTEAVIPLDKLPGLISDALRDALGGRGALASAGVVVQNMYVRDDQDIVKIARELYNLQQRTARGRGLK